MVQAKGRNRRRQDLAYRITRTRYLLIISVHIKPAKYNIGPGPGTPSLMEVAVVPQGHGDAFRGRWEAASEIDGHCNNPGPCVLLGFRDMQSNGSSAKRTMTADIPIDLIDV